ncbi:bifunctional protein GlmU-like [Oratosquilla oratoria]|uniref:bifunctional protein GlmU-like n=1 Tax=Oratosquilla oratoria TaxID=337810 RepID=UPI003F77618F
MAPCGIFVLSCCGYLNSATLHFASNENGATKEIETLTGYFEVLSMTGSVSREGSHLHITLADSTGQTIGGHLMGIPLSTT